MTLSPGSTWRVREAQTGLPMRNAICGGSLEEGRAGLEVETVNFLQSVKFTLREVCSVRASTWGMSAMLVGLVIASFGTFAFAEPANQAAATPTPTPGPSCVVPPQGMVVRIDTPSPGAVISPGSNVLVQGVAYDTA